MIERSLQSRDDRQPECETHDCSDQCADRADDRTVPQQYESKVPLGRADRGEHAELAEPSLSDDGEAGCGNERRQEQEDSGYGEHRQRRCLLVAAPRPGCHGGGPVALGGSLEEGADRVVACVDQDRDVVGCSRGSGGDECELVAQITWVLDDADSGPSAAIESQRLPDLEPEERGHPVGDGYLVAAFGVGASLECKAWGPVRSARVLSTELHRFNGAGHSQRAVADDVGRPEPVREGGETRLQRVRIGAIQLEEVIGGAELGIVRRGRVVGDRDAADRGRDRDGQKRDHQDLLPPLAAEQAPRPADQRATRGNAAAARSSGRQTVRE